jgi:hypothetical protein
MAAVLVHAVGDKEPAGGPEESAQPASPDSRGTEDAGLHWMRTAAHISFTFNGLV